MIEADGGVGRRRPRLDLLVQSMGEAPVREALDVSGEDWESILSGGMELDETMLAHLETMTGRWARRWSGGMRLRMKRRQEQPGHRYPAGPAPGPGGPAAHRPGAEQPAVQCGSALERAVRHPGRRTAAGCALPEIAQPTPVPA